MKTSGKTAKKRRKARRAGSARSQYSLFTCANIYPDGVMKTKSPAGGQCPLPILAFHAVRTSPPIVLCINTKARRAASRHSQYSTFVQYEHLPRWRYENKIPGGNFAAGREIHNKELIPLHILKLAQETDFGQKRKIRFYFYRHG